MEKQPYSTDRDFKSRRILCRNTKDWEQTMKAIKEAQKNIKGNLIRKGGILKD